MTAKNLTVKAAKSSTAVVPIENSLGSLIMGLNGFNGAPLSQDDTMYYNLRWYLISNNRSLLSQLYVENGIVQTLVDQPVDDAFSKGFDVQSGQLDADQVEELEQFCKTQNVTKAITSALKWARLYGGGAVLILTDQDPKIPFKISSIRKLSRIKFVGIDMWELYYSRANMQGDINLDDGLEFYDYYGHKIHKSRVYKIEGKEAPSFERPRLRGWGMSELEKVVRSLNQYLKNQDVVYELLDEAKIDVYKIDNFNESLLSDQGTASVTKRVQYGNTLKNYNNAIVMDKEDEYEQKQITFSGLSEILTQIRQGLAADLKMPMTKLFGISSAGFSSGEDDIENYNSMIESEIRAKSEHIVLDLLKLACQKLFEFVPDDLKISFPSLRILDDKDQEQVKNDQFNRIMACYQSGLIDAITMKAALNKAGLLPSEIDENEAAGEPLNGDFVIGSGAKVEG